GAAGDMLTAALLDLFSEKQDLVKELNQIGIDGIEYVLKEENKSGIHGLGMSVKIHGEEENVIDFDIKEDELTNNHDHDHECCHGHGEGHHHHDHKGECCHGHGEG